MKDKKCGTLILCFSLLILSFEVFSVKLIQSADKVNGYFYDNIWLYYKNGYILFPIIVTVCVLIYAIYLLIKK